MIESQADLKQIHDDLPLFYDVETIGTGSQSHSGVNAESTLTTSASSDAAIMQTKQRYNYSSGKSSVLFITFRNFDSETNIYKRIGYFNSASTGAFTASRDGLFLENLDGAISFVIAKNGTQTKVAQADWDDPMDGTGDSGIDLDLSNDGGNLIMFIDYEWLGVGEVRFGFIKNGAYHLANQVDHIMSDGVYMSSPNHSIRAEIRQDGAGSGTLRLICATYNVENGTNELGKVLSENSGAAHINASISGTRYAVIGIRLKSANIDTLIDIINYTLLNESNDNVLWEAYINPTISGTFTYSSVTNSSMQVAIAPSSGATTSSGGTRIFGEYLINRSSSSSGQANALRLGG